MADETNEKNNEALLEATLFLSGKYLSVQELVMFTNINPIMLKELLQKLQEKYEKHSAFCIVCKSEKYKMDVKPEYAHLVNKLVSGQTEFSKAEQETLAIIAYKQPITQAVVVKIRGNKSYEHIKHLIEVGLVKAKRAGRTLSLQLDESFYDYFNVVKKEKEESADEAGIESKEASTESKTEEQPAEAEVEKLAEQKEKDEKAGEEETEIQNNELN